MEEGREIVFIGDSHLLSLVNVFLKDEISKKYTVIPIVAGECFPVLGFKKIYPQTGTEQDTCSLSIQNERFNYINELDDPIIIVGGKVTALLVGWSIP